MAGISNTYDPTTTAQALAESATAARRSTLTNQSTAASATERALTTLGSALSAYQNSLSAMTGLNKTLSANSAAFSDSAIASASATSAAAPGTYAFFVEQVASAHQISFSDVKSFANTGSITFTAGGAPIKIELASRDTAWTPRDLALAINTAPGNTSLSASVVTTGEGISELILTSKPTGEKNAITITPEGTDTALSDKFAETPNTLSKPLDAIVYVGSIGGTPIKQASNTFNVIDGVSMTFTKAQAGGSAPVTLTVGSDAAKTTSNVQAFVDAYNKLKSAVDGLVSNGNVSSGGTPGIFSADSGVRALRDRLISALRGTGANSLATFGIIANRQGTLSVDNTRLQKALASNPTGLDTLIGSTAADNTSGIAGQLDFYLKQWTNSTNGQIGSRKNAVSKLQVDLTKRQTVLDRQYDSAYTRYLAQFTKLQTVQSSMSYNTSLFDALFSDKKD